MTLRLILTRHAKSSWTDPSVEDRDRPLNTRGEKSARAVGKWLAKRGHVPELALVSSSERTRQTWRLVARAFDAAPAAAVGSPLRDDCTAPETRLRRGARAKGCACP